MAEDNRIITAARLAEAFGASPIELLNVSTAEWLILIACGKVVEADRQEAEREARGY